MTAQQFEIKDSGERRDFDTGAKRDMDHDKPRFDLIPMTVIRKVIDFYPQKKMFRDLPESISNDLKVIMWNLGLLWGETVNNDLLLELIWIVLEAIRNQETDSILKIQNNSYDGLHLISPKTYLRLANHYGGGAKKYDPWNWSKGMPLSIFHASLMRHIFAVMNDMTDEDHLSAIFFNAACILHFTIIGRTDLDDVTTRLEEWKNASHQFEKKKTKKKITIEEDDPTLQLDNNAKTAVQKETNGTRLITNKPDPDEVEKNKAKAERAKKNKVKLGRTAAHKYKVKCNECGETFESDRKDDEMGQKCPSCLEEKRSRFF